MAVTVTPHPIVLSLATELVSDENVRKTLADLVASQKLAEAHAKAAEAAALAAAEHVPAVQAAAAKVTAMAAVDAAADAAAGRAIARAAARAAASDAAGAAKQADVAKQAATGARNAAEKLSARLSTALADFGVTSTAADLRSFAGYCGGSVGDPLKRPNLRWQVLFLDANFAAWLIFRNSDIKLFDRKDDETALGGLRDYLWVPGEALVGRGDTLTSAEAVVRAGTFSRSGDLATSLRGDTNGRRSGLMADAVTPLCCGRYSR